MNQIKVLFFATLKEYIGQRQLLLEVPEDADVRLVKDHLSTVYAPLQPLLETCIVSINREFALDEDRLPSGAEVAFSRQSAAVRVQNFLRFTASPKKLWTWMS
jgi:molybdopterin converting factor small subunit